jgi:hypothetical protein
MPAVVCLWCAASAFAAGDPGQDTNKDGKPDLWASYDKNGFLTVAADDSEHRDGRPHHWRYFRAGKVYRREWDRNFDNKADLIILEKGGRMVEKKQDDNFDGRFEKSEKFPS